jgi:putative PEP-CTERM system TPR-repeat lipoprotein
MKQHKLLRIVLLSTIVALSTGCNTDPNVRKVKYLASGDRYSAEGKYREAIIQYSNALKADRNFAKAHYALGKVYVHLGAYDAASRELTRTIQLQPDNVQARIDLGNLLVAQGATDAAAQQANAASVLQPNNADVHALLSAIAFNKGDMATATTEIQHAIELAPDRSMFRDNLAVLQMRDPNSKSAAESTLKEAVELDPKSAQPYLLLSAYYVQNNRLPEAEQSCQRAVAADPHSVSARIELAQVLVKEGHPNKAEQVLRQASNDLSNDPKGLRVLADYYSQTGQNDKAAAEFATLASSHPKDLSLQKAYLRALLQQKNYTAAQKLSERLMKEDAKDPEIAALNGIVLLNSGHAHEAVSALQSGAKDFPHDAFIEYWLGSAALSTGDTALAKESFEKVIALRPESVDALDQLAQMSISLGDMRGLSDIGTKAIAAVPTFAGGYVWRAIAEEHDNQLDKAQADLSTALRIAPSSPRAHVEMGKLLLAEGKLPEGEAMLEKALQLDPNQIQAIRLLVEHDLYVKQPAKAFARLNEAAQNHPKNSAILDLLTELELNQGQVKQAALTAQKAMQLNPSDEEAVMLVAQTSVQLGSIPQAIQAWQQWLTAHPADANATAILGTLEEAGGNTQTAENDYKKSLQMQPQQPLASNNLAYLMLQNGGDPDVALSLAQTARQKLPNSPNTADTLAWAYYHKGAYQFARELLEQSLRSGPPNADMEYHLGMVYSKLKDDSDAAAHLRKAVSLGRGGPVATEADDALHHLS